MRYEAIVRYEYYAANELRELMDMIKKAIPDVLYYKIVDNEKKVNHYIKYEDGEALIT